MPDFDAIAASLAARYAPGVTTPPAPGGLTDIRLATADIPNAAPRMLPAVLVYFDRAALQGGNQTRVGLTTWRVQFLLRRQGIDLARDQAPLRKWATVLADRLKPSTGAVALGGTITRAAVTSITIGSIRFGAKVYSGLELIVEARTDEAWS